MRRKILAGIAPMAALWSIVLVCAALGSVRAAADNSRWGANYFPNVTMTTQDGVEVKFYDDVLKGKIVAINLIYTTCKYACPLETARLAQVQKVLGDRMGRDIFFYSITIDPDHDTPAVLKEYAEKYHVGPGWTFLTGKKDDIELISKKLGLYSDPDPANLDGHTPMLLVGNEATGQWMRNSAVDNPRFIATTIGDWLDSWQTRSKTPVKSYAEAPTLTLDRGQYTFKNHCSACHTIGNGVHIGPDLAGVTSTRDRDWLLRFIVAPDKVRASGDPIALALRAKFKQVLMPNLDMGGDDAAVLIDYIERQTRAVQAESATPKGPSAAAVAPAANIKSLVDPYLQIQIALNGDSLDGVANDARTIASEAARLGASAAPIQSAAAAMAQATDLKGARVAMAALGDALMSYAKESGASVGDDVKVAYCPMVQKYWLQKGDIIRNPFYGKQMSDCGRITPDLPTLK